MTDKDSLSSAFISHVKVLFDILDENHTGFVRLSDIESHWQGNDCVIPRDIVLRCLRNVASPSGRLSFDMFTVGLQRAMAAWRISGTDRNNVTTNSDENRGTSAGNTTTDKYISHTYDNNSFVSRRVHKTSGVRNGLSEDDDAGNIGSVTLRLNADGLKWRQHEGTSAGHNEKYAHVQKSKGIQIFIIMQGGVNPQLGIIC